MFLKTNILHIINSIQKICRDEFNKWYCKQNLQELKVKADLNQYIFEKQITFIRPLMMTVSSVESA